MELAINSLEDDARLAVMALPEKVQATLEQIMTRLEGPFRRKRDGPRVEAHILCSEAAGVCEPYSLCGNTSEYLETPGEEGCLQLSLTQITY